MSAAMNVGTSSFSGTTMGAARSPKGIVYLIDNNIKRKHDTDSNREALIESIILNLKNSFINERSKIFMTDKEHDNFIMDICKKVILFHAQLSYGNNYYSETGSSNCYEKLLKSLSNLRARKEGVTNKVIEIVATRTNADQRLDPFNNFYRYEKIL